MEDPVTQQKPMWVFSKMNWCRRALTSTIGFCTAPRVQLTHGQLLSLLQFDFSGDMLAKGEAHERDLALYEQASGEKISDGLRVGIVLNRVTDTEFATHSLLNSETFQTWTLFRQKLVDVSCARAAASGACQMRRGANDSSTAPMEMDELQRQEAPHVRKIWSLREGLLAK